MCKEDVRIGRQKRTTPTVVPYNGADPVRVLIARPDRTAALFSIAGNSDPTIVTQVAIGVMGPEGFQAVAFLLPGSPTLLLRIEDVGDLVTGELWWAGVSNGGFALSVTEVFLTVPLEDV